MFNDRFLLTQAVLERRKKQTRRLVKQKMINDYYSLLGANETGYISGFDDSLEDFLLERAPYKVGEVVAVAQRYSELGSASFEEWERNTDWFRKGFSNKMFVKSELMPHQVKITNVRVQKLQEITYHDCLREGVYIFDEDPMNPLAYIYTYPSANQLFYHPIDAYAQLIDAISGKGTWESNPYVYAYDFELVR